MTASATVSGVTVSNPDKVWWPDEGITKLDLIRYYDAVWPLLRPWLRDRPLTAERCPDGMKGSCFYQKNFPAGSHPPYSVRRRPRAPISLPLDWDEVRPRLDPARWNVRSAARRLAGTDPWAGFWRSRQRLRQVTAP